MSFAEALSQELGSDFFAGRVRGGHEAIFHLELSGAAPSISVHLSQENSEGEKESSLWSLELSDDNVKRHMEDDVGIYDQLNTFASYFCDALIADVRVDHRTSSSSKLVAGMSQVSLVFSYVISTTVSLQGVLKLTLVQSGVHRTVFQALSRLFDYNYERQRSAIQTRKTDRKQPLQVRAKTSVSSSDGNLTGDGAATQGDGTAAAAPVDEGPVVQKAKIRKTGGVSIFPGRKK